MTDLHTHILPGIDDGAKNIEQSIQLLKAEIATGVNPVSYTHLDVYKSQPQYQDGALPLFPG